MNTRKLHLNILKTYHGVGRQIIRGCKSKFLQKKMSEDI